MKNNEEGKFMSSVKVGAKGQIVIPKEARKMFNIKPGDTLLLLADTNRGIAINRLDYFDEIANAIFSGKVDIENQDEKKQHSDDPSQLIKFAKEVKDIQKEDN